jgi:hypothetical protein
MQQDEDWPKQFPVVSNADMRNDLYRACRALGKPCVFIVRDNESRTYCAELDMTIVKYNLTELGERSIYSRITQYAKKKSQIGLAGRTRAKLEGLTLKDAQAICGWFYETACWESELISGLRGEKE